MPRLTRLDALGVLQHIELVRSAHPAMWENNRILDEV